MRRLRGFRTELRELMMRASEYGVSPNQLRALGQQHGHPEWVAAADFTAEYLQVMGGARPDQLDSAELVRAACVALAVGEPGETVSALKLVVVDDVQEATKSTVNLITALARRGIAIVAFGDPDVATNAFRGGEPDLLGRLGAVLVRDVTTLNLDTVYRHGPGLRAFTSAITDRIGTAGTVGTVSTVGTSGIAKTPQLHFELRQARVAVDPLVSLPERP